MGASFAKIEPSYSTNDTNDGADKRLDNFTKIINSYDIGSNLFNT